MDRRGLLRAAFVMPIVAALAPLLPRSVASRALPLIVDPYVPADTVYLLDLQRLYNGKLVSWETVLREYGFES